MSNDLQRLAELVRRESGIDVERLGLRAPEGAVARVAAAMDAAGVLAARAFKLGRAYDALRDEQAARRAYAQALRTLDAADERHVRFAAQIDAASIAAACRARLTGS